MPQKALDSLAAGRLTTLPMQDPQSLYEQAQQHIAELHAAADRRRGVRPKGVPWRAAIRAILCRRRDPTEESRIDPDELVSDHGAD
jgi:hypothetical protein